MGRVMVLGNNRPPPVARNTTVNTGNNGKKGSRGSRGSEEIRLPPAAAATATQQFSAQYSHADIRELSETEPYDLQSPTNLQPKRKPLPFTPMPSRKYCCSNTAQKECKLWAIVDMVTALLIWILLTYFAITLKTDQQFLEAIVETDKENERDLNRFLHFSPIKQDLTIVVAILREMTSVILGALLFLAAHKLTHQHVQMWLVATFIAVIVDLVLFIPKMAYTQSKFLYASMMMTYFLYKWYEVWIASILYKEIKEDSQMDMRSEGEINPSYERDAAIESYEKAQDLATLNQFAPNNIQTIAHNLRTYGRVGMVNTTGWETDTIGSNETFVLSQPPKRRNNAQTNRGDMATGQGNSFGSMDPDYQPHYRY